MNSSNSDDPGETIISTDIYGNPFKTVYVGPDNWFSPNFTIIKNNGTENLTNLLNRADSNFN
jgi:hypothetical protein